MKIFIVLFSIIVSCSSKETVERCVDHPQSNYFYNDITKKCGVATAEYCYSAKNVTEVEKLSKDDLEKKSKKYISDGYKKIDLDFFTKTCS